MTRTLRKITKENLKLEKAILQLANIEAVDEGIVSMGTEMPDLRAVVRIPVEEDSDFFASLIAPTAMCTALDIDEAGLLDKALLNTLAAKYEITPLWEILELPTPEIPLWVITNEEKMFGAAAILSTKVLNKCREIVGGDFYILPSSIHEVLVLPKSASPSTVNELKLMVACVNASEVEPEDRLSDNVYLYDGKYIIEA